MIVLAHPGHWLVSLSYLAPLVFLVGVIVVGKIRDRRNDVIEPPAAEAPPASREAL